MEDAQDDHTRPGAAPPSTISVKHETRSTHITTTIDGLLERFSKVLANPAGLDKSLATIGYGSLLASELSRWLSEAGRRRQIKRLSALLLLSSKSPGSLSVVIPARRPPSPVFYDLSKRLKALYGLVADVRVFMRLWGLLAIYRWGKQIWSQRQQTDRTLRTILLAQVMTNTIFQILENLAYLSSKRVWHWGTEKQAQAWKWSARFWFGHVLLESLRLAVVAKRKSQEFTTAFSIEAKDDREGSVETAPHLAWWEKWRMDLAMTSAYAPLTLHFSREGGLLGDAWIGMFGLLASGLGFRELWSRAI